MTTLTEKLAAGPEIRPSKTKLDLWVATLTDDEAAAVLNAATNPAWGHVALRDTLHAEGAPHLSDTAFRAWRVSKGWTA